MELTRESVTKIAGVLNTLFKQKCTPRGSYILAKNKRLADEEVKTIEEAAKNIKFPDGCEKFDQLRLDLCNELCLKGPDGKPVLTNNGTTFSFDEETRAKFDVSLTELVEKFKDDLDKRQELIEEFAASLKETVNIDFLKIKVEDIPTADVTPELIDTISPLIED